ncbi:hypothetical protein [Intestinibacter bartlettii]|uniref:Uncharacterized protein n=1 Tax=Intestinibacter bartlettii CAG:1329 TaxID=1263063 RepID=R5XH48_9FIRM|nr:hypothetical protein [Intestinibacter bartlettii]CDA11709.1 uncharacterized protein BN488_02667 [Intestinibacter bartlettii CAG:1329]
MDTNNLLMTGFVLTLGAMAILISIISFGFMIMYQIRNKVKVNNYVKMIILIAFIIGVILVFVSSSRLDLKSLGF